MKHRYAHVKNMRDLEDELLKIRLKKQIIRSEISIVADTVKSQILTGQFVLNSILNLFGMGKFKKEPPGDAFDKATSYAGWLSNMLSLLNGLRR